MGSIQRPCTNGHSHQIPDTCTYYQDPNIYQAALAYANQNTPAIAYQDTSTAPVSLQDKFKIVNTTVKKLLLLYFHIKPKTTDNQARKRLLNCNICHRGPDGFSLFIDKKGEHQFRPYTHKNQPSNSIAEALRHLHNHHPRSLYFVPQVFICPYDENCIEHVSPNKLYPHRSLLHSLPDKSRPGRGSYQKFLLCSCGTRFSTYHGYAKHANLCGHYEAHLRDIFVGSQEDLIYMHKG